MIRLERLKLENFLSWQELDWSPSHPIACLIGENDTGKSNLFRSFSLLASLSNQTLQESFAAHPFSELAYPGSKQIVIELQGILLGDEPQQFRYRLQMNDQPGNIPQTVEHLSGGPGSLTREGQQTVVNGHYHLPTRKLPLSILNLEKVAHISNAPNGPFFAQVLKDLGHLTVLHLTAENIRQICSPDSPIQPNGLNLAAALDSMISDPESRANFIQIEARLRELLPRIGSIGVKPVRDPQGESQRSLRFGSKIEGQPFYFDAKSASDGTLLLLALQYFALRPESSGVVVMEEPEFGFHPRLLDGFLKQLRDNASSLQIFFTTHSPIFLDSLQPNEIWITSRSGQGSSRIQSMNSFPDLDQWTDNFGCGEIWMNLSESTLLKSQ